MKTHRLGRSGLQVSELCLGCMSFGDPLRGGHPWTLPKDESRDLIKELTAHCIKPEFIYSHNWRQNDLVMWDDCSTQHKATFDYPESLPRLMHRTTVVAA